MLEILHKSGSIRNRTNMSVSSELGNVRHQTKSSCKDGWGSENKMKIVQTAYNYENKMKISNIKEIL